MQKTAEEQYNDLQEPLVGTPPHLSSEALIALLRPYYSQLEVAPCDLNAEAIIAWTHTFRLKVLIEDGVLYVVGSRAEQFFLWCPPLGENLVPAHLDRAFTILRSYGGNCRTSIGNVWREYSLWSPLHAQGKYEVVQCAEEYFYDSARVASLPSPSLRGKRRERDRFRCRFAPQTFLYSPAMAPKCLQLLQKWVERKHEKEAGPTLTKCETEADATRQALVAGIPLEGIVVFVGKDVAAFSLGVGSAGIFNCLFEKADPDLPGAGAFVFSELGQHYSARFPIVNAGDDWDLPGLRHSKRSWRPLQMRPLYSVYML